MRLGSAMPFACWMSGQRVAFPQKVRAILLRVSPRTTVYVRGA
ncbi:hypothetical protein [Dactylosporangium roseum]|nr:hypothetical protein [Dactylosporangium roseum]